MPFDRQLIYSLGLDLALALAMILIAWWVGDWKELDSFALVIGIAILFIDKTQYRLRVFRHNRKS
jgi:hypothetical protein